MFNAILVDFLNGNDKSKFYSSESKRAVRAATLMRDRVNQNALRNLIQSHFQAKIRENKTVEVWDRISFATHKYEPMVLPKEYKE